MFIDYISWVFFYVRFWWDIVVDKMYIKVGDLGWEVGYSLCNEFLGAEGMYRYVSEGRVGICENFGLVWEIVWLILVVLV